jgi:hypothetical protein
VVRNTSHRCISHHTPTYGVGWILQREHGDYERLKADVNECLESAGLTDLISEATACDPHGTRLL